MMMDDDNNDRKDGRQGAEGPAATLRAAFARAAAAHLVIDVQKQYCDPETGYTARQPWGVRNDMARLVDGIAAFAQRVRGAAPPVWVAHTSPMALGEDALPDAPRTEAGLYAPAVDLEALVPGLLYRQPRQDGDMVLAKQWRDAFNGTDLAARLRARGVNTLLLSGVFADQCVHSTAISAVKNGFDTYVVEDLTMPAYYGSGYRQEMEDAGVRFVRSHNVPGAAP